MPLILIVRFFTSCLSLFILVAAAYLAWTWFDGEWVRTVSGLVHVRDDWRLWTAIGLFTWSALGGFILKALLARSDTDPLNSARGDGTIITGANGASLYVERHGNPGAPCLVLTHGWGMDSTIWGYSKRDLSKDFQVIVWDLPGTGKSRPGPNGVHLSEFASNLAAIIAWSGQDKAVLVGHSIGGMTTQTFARDFPALFDKHVAGVVLLNTTYRNPLHAMILEPLAVALRFALIEPMMRLTRWLTPLAWLSAWQSYLSGSAHLANRIAFGKSVTRSQLGHTTLLSTRNSPGHQAQGNLSMFRWDASRALGQHEAPVLILAGKIDILTRAEKSYELAAQTPSAVVHEIAGANHMGFLEQHEIYNEEIARFARSVFLA
ncbi:alpha/beta fold hydrolase [Asticcacaulis sp.]|uniref:alpha/beta fold hydrolase n=1 Tax=Asticcacaulis sp. TaxID=1872648 RepID=UPI003F7CD3A7